MLELIILNYLFHSIAARHGFWSGMQLFEGVPFIWCDEPKSSPNFHHYSHSLVARHILTHWTLRIRHLLLEKWMIVKFC
jgi:hypothetical protein